MRFSLQAQYAICGMFDLAYNGHDVPVAVQAIGERQVIPARYLEQIFQRLRRAGLVTGKRGPGGGYVLARPPAEITLCDVVVAVEGGAERWFASEVEDAPAVPYRPKFLWPRLGSRFAGVLTAITLEDLCREAAQASVQRAEVALSYVI
ncbi:Rrf2 family transcriptional regulator [Myxococcota bacterium]|nr:Rrf2 family transcriptional regulator [Myxococcota bacterium]